VLDLGFRGPFLHHNDHKVFLVPSTLAFHLAKFRWRPKIPGPVPSLSQTEST
jgi:hypothetical protein